MKKIIVFGTGITYYQYQNVLKKHEIVMFIDNNKEKQGTWLDKRRIREVDKILDTSFDFVVIVAEQWQKMRKQLLALGVKQEKIIYYEELGKLEEEEEIVSYGEKPSQEEDKSIIIFTNRLENSGAELAVFVMAKMMKKLGYDVCIAACYNGSLRDDIVKSGIRVAISLKYGYWNNSVLELVKNYHAVLVNTLIRYELVYRLQNLNKRIIWWLHEPENVYKQVEVEVINRIDSEKVEIYAVSEYAKKVFKKHILDKKIDIFMLSIEDRRKEVKEKREEDKKITFAVVARICELKNQRLVLEAMKLMDEMEYRKINVLFIGGGANLSYENMLLKETKEMKNVRFLGEMTQDDINEMYNNSKIDVLICPSLEETLSISTVEALMHGKPVIVSDNTGIASHITNYKEGFVVKNNNAVDLKEKIQWFLRNTDRLEQMGKAAREKYEEDFSIDKLTDSVMKLRLFV